MGKVEEEQSLSTPAPAEVSEEGARNPCEIRKFVGIRCVSVLVFGVAVLLSAIFWLPPFLRGDRGDLELDGQFGAPIMASFKLQKPVPLLEANVLKLEYDIFEEIGVPNSVVLISSLEPVPGSNWTIVVFGVWPYPKSSPISSAGLSVLRSSFVSLVVQQSTLHLTPSLFGDPSFFQVLKLSGGITIIPSQSGFLLQKVQIPFNFTLNFSIYQIQEIFDELKRQLKSGIHLTSYENLYIKLTNLHGSTLAPPVIVQSSILLAVGNLPSQPRLKQLAQTITSSPARNLGLNHTVFGKVKKIQLSLYLQHSLNSGTGSSTSWSPSSAPLPHPKNQYHHHHHHHYVHHPPSHPSPVPTPAPTPERNHRALSPTGCRYRISRKPKTRAHSVHFVVPVVSPRPSAVPHLRGDPPTPSLPVPLDKPEPPISSPLPAVFFARAQPPTKSTGHTKFPHGMLPTAQSLSPSPSSSSDGGFPTVRWALPLLLSLVIHV